MCVQIHRRTTRIICTNFSNYTVEERIGRIVDCGRKVHIGNIEATSNRKVSAKRCVGRCGNSASLNFNRLRFPDLSRAVALLNQYARCIIVADAHFDASGSQTIIIRIATGNGVADCREVQTFAHIVINCCNRHYLRSGPIRIIKRQ